MSGLMHWFVTIVTVVSILACIWLIHWSTKQSQGIADDATMGHKWDGDLEEYNNPLPRWWLYLFYITIIFALVYFALYPGLGNFAGTLGWSQEGQYDKEIVTANERYEPIYAAFGAQPADELLNNQDALRLGASLYQSYCTACHGSDARGAKGYPNLADNDWLYGGTADAIEYTLVNGRNGVMPPMGAVFDEAGLNALATLLADVPADAATIDNTQYQAVCAACHGADGRGLQALGAPNLRDDIWLYGGSVEEIKYGIVNGRNNMMPPHGNLLGPARTRILTAYIMSLSQDTSGSGN